MSEIQRVLQNLLQEQISIRDLVTILETLADYAPSTRDIDVLTEYVRQNLKRAIYKKYFPVGEMTSVVTLDLRSSRKYGFSKADRQECISALDPQVLEKSLILFSQRLIS